MLCDGVLVIAKDENLKTGLCSGTRIGDWVLTHGTILVPFCDNVEYDSENSSEDPTYSSEYSLGKMLNDMAVSYYSKESKILDTHSLTFTVIMQDVNYQNSQKVNEIDKASHTVATVFSQKAEVEKVFQCTSVKDVLNSAVVSWELDVVDDNSELPVPLAISTLLLLKLTPNGSSNTRGFPESLTMAAENIHIYRGMEILVESTPFNSLSFFNSWSCGIVSNLLGQTNSVLLLDARLTVGCEGAPIFVCDHGKKGSLIGIVMKSMTWLNGEWIGFSIGLTVKDVIHTLSLKTAVPNDLMRLHSDKDSISNFTGILDAAIVRVCSGHKWGSGVVIDAADGIILTCSHVLIEGEDVVDVQCGDVIESITGKVLYVTPPGMLYDIAVISVGRNKHLKQLPLAENPPNKGETVFSVGYSYFSNDSFGATKVTISRGVISSVSPDGPIHATCFVHSGQSGGALIRPPYQLLGLIVSNIQQESTIFPEHCLSLSYECFLTPLKAFIDSKDVSKLNPLTKTDFKVRRKWNFGEKCKL